MTTFAEADLRQDAFLGGQLQLWQPRKGYRAGLDPILLAACVPARSGQSVLDLGCGAGAAILALGTRVAGVQVVGIERQAAFADLARRNGAALGLEVHCADLSDMPAALKAQSFDHVIANPPYYDRRTGTQAPDTSREAALGEDTPLATWLEVGAKRLKPRGYLYMILKADRLMDLLAATQSPMGSIEIAPIAPRQGRDAELVLFRSRKDGRAALKIHAPIILHAGAEHLQDADDYRPEIADVLRNGSALRAF